MMKKHKEHASTKRGKGEADAPKSIKRHDPNDLGDPRGTRQPRGEVPQEKHEKGDKHRPY